MTFSLQYGRWLVLWALLFPVLVAGCGGQDFEESQGGPSVTTTALEQSFTNQTMIETIEGQRKWILKSRQMQKFSVGQEVLLIEVDMDFYRDGAVFSTLTSDSARVNPDTHDVHAFGHVVLITDDGRRLETEELFYNNKTQLITNDVFDHYTWSEGVATGIGMEASSDLEYFEIKNGFKSKISDDQPAPQGD